MTNDQPYRGALAEQYERNADAMRNADALRACIGARQVTCIEQRQNADGTVTETARATSVAVAQHAWVCISAQHEGPGIQRMVDYADNADLARQVRAILQDWDACPAGDPDYAVLTAEGARDYADFLVRDVGFSYASTGLLLETVPCNASGTNLVDSTEPSGE